MLLSISFNLSLHDILNLAVIVSILSIILSLLFRFLQQEKISEKEKIYVICLQGEKQKFIQYALLFPSIGRQYDSN